MIVLDMNAAAAIVRGTPEGLGLQALMLSNEEAAAPRFFITEAANVAWKFVRAGWLDEEGALLFFERSVELVDRYIEDEALIVEAIHEAIRCEHPVYDMLYFVLARRNAATLFTLDKKLRAICQANGVNCIDPVTL